MLFPPLLGGVVNWIVDLADFGLALGPPSRRALVRWGVGVKACGDELGAWLRWAFAGRFVSPAEGRCLALPLLW